MIEVDSNEMDDFYADSCAINLSAFLLQLLLLDLLEDTPRQLIKTIKGNVTVKLKYKLKWNTLGFIDGYRHVGYETTDCS